MILQRVVYELFEWETDMADSFSRAAYVELFRQVRLEGPDGERVFISWDWVKGKGDYFAAFAGGSFFTNVPNFEHDVSETPMWHSLVNKQVEPGYHNADPQVVEVRSGEDVVYCCSWWMDRVYVMRTLLNPRQL